MMFIKKSSTMSNRLSFIRCFIFRRTLLHPELFKMIRYADEHGIYTSLSTNGHFLSKENAEKVIRSGLKKIIISLDGITQESYEKYRIGGNLDAVLNGIKNLAEIKKQQRTRYPKIVIQFLVFKHNEEEIGEVKPLCEKLGANRVEFKSAQISHPENSPLIPSNQKFARYVQHNTHLKIKNKLKNRCFRIWSTLVITWEGHANPCCFDKYNKHTIGTISNKNTLQVWKSLSFNQFRMRVLENRKQIPMCCNCTEGLKLNEHKIQVLSIFS